MSDAQIFDPENELLEPHRSPGLQAVKPSFDVVETPPPIATRDSSEEPSEDGEDGGSGGVRDFKDQDTLPQANYVLFRQLGPNFPEVANHALKHSLGPGCRGQEEDRSMTVVETIPNGVDTNGVEAVHDGNQRQANTLVEEDEDFELIDPLDDTDRGTSDESPKVNGVHSPQWESQSKSWAPAAPLPSTTGILNVKPPPRPPPIVTSGSGKMVSDQGQVEHDSLAKSPLARFTIPPEIGDPSNTLPAMQMSPPRSTSNGSPEPKQTIPSINSALSDIGTPFSMPSPNLTRASSSQMSQYGPSPHSSSAMSPPSLPVHPSLWRSNTREGSISTPSDYAIVSAPGSISASTPAPSLIHQSPATSHPTPITTSPDAMHPDGSVEHILSPDSDCYEQNGTEGPFSNNSYKCTIPLCTASSFQTQYLLNSHMNVHSDTRPHFCSVRGCVRGPGGQGFKRKNEMIR
jgi:hypothetical protein